MNKVIVRSLLFSGHLANDAGHVRIVDRSLEVTSHLAPGVVIDDEE